MRRWWLSAVCVGAIASLLCEPGLAIVPEDSDEAPIDAETPPAIDMVQLAKQLREAVERGDITQEEMDEHLLKAAMGEVADVVPIMPQRRAFGRRTFDAEKSRQRFDEWLDTVATEREADYPIIFEYIRLHEEQQIAMLVEQENTGRPLGVLLAHAIETDPRFRRNQIGRSLAVRALSMVVLGEDELRDHTVRELLLVQLRNGAENAQSIISGSLANVPEDQRGLWYAPFAELLRSVDYEKVLVSCSAIQQLGVIAAEDRAYLLSLIRDMRGASDELFRLTYLDPYSRVGLPYQFWPRSQVRAQATSALLHTSEDAASMLEELGAIEGRARLDVASGIASAFCSSWKIDTDVWNKEAAEEAFALLDRILADPSAKVVVVDQYAELWSDLEFRPFGTSILSDLCDSVSFAGNPMYASQALSSALRAARTHGEPELVWAVYFFVRDQDPDIVQRVRRGTTTIDIGAEMVELAKELRQAVERGEITEHQMQRMLEQEAERQISVP